MSVTPIRNPLLMVALAVAAALALQVAARGDVQLEDLPRPMETNEAPYSPAQYRQPPYSQPSYGRPSYSRAPLSQAPIDEQPIVEEEVPSSILSPSLPGSHFGGGYPPGGPGAYSLPHAECYGDPWTWQLLPQGLIYHSYLAGPKEARMATVLQHQTGGDGALWDATVGGRIGLIRYGTPRGFRPDGWEVDVEGAAMPQLFLNHDRDLHSVDFRGGVLMTYGLGPFQAKFGYYHLSSHIGDEFFIKNPGFDRLNFSRDCLIFGIGYFLTDNIRLYGETAWAFACDGGSQPWEFQFGAEYSPINHPGWRGDPFTAINAHLRQEVNFGGSLVVQVGWQWLSVANGSRLRTGFEYFNGKNEQYQFYYNYVQQFGYGIWYDY